MDPKDPKDPLNIPLEVIRAFAERPRTQAVKVTIIEDLDSVRVDPATAGRAGRADGVPLPPWLLSPPAPEPAEGERVSLGVMFFPPVTRGPSVQ